MVEILKRPNVLQFLGGLIAVLVGALVLKGSVEGMGLVGLGVFAMGNAIKSPHDAMSEAKARKSLAPPPPAVAIEIDPDPTDVPTVRRGKP